MMCIDLGADAKQLIGFRYQCSLPLIIPALSSGDAAVSAIPAPVPMPLVLFSNFCISFSTNLSATNRTPPLAIKPNPINCNQNSIYT